MASDSGAFSFFALYRAQRGPRKGNVGREQREVRPLAVGKSLGRSLSCV